jgi:hypothetical protein
MSVYSGISVLNHPRRLCLRSDFVILVTLHKSLEAPRQGALDLGLVNGFNQPLTLIPTELVHVSVQGDGLDLAYSTNPFVDYRSRFLDDRFLCPTRDNFGVLLQKFSAILGMFQPFGLWVVVQKMASSETDTSIMRALMVSVDRLERWVVCHVTYECTVYVTGRFPSKLMAWGDAALREVRAKTFPLPPLGFSHQRSPCHSVEVPGASEDEPSSSTECHSPSSTDRHFLNSRLLG